MGFSWWNDSQHSTGQIKLEFCRFQESVAALLAAESGSKPVNSSTSALPLMCMKIVRWYCISRAHTPSIHLFSITSAKRSSPGVPLSGHVLQMFLRISRCSRARWDSQSLQRILGVCLPVGHVCTSLENHPRGVLVNCPNHLNWLRAYRK